VPPEGVCPGAVITRTIGNLDEEGNVTQSVSEVVEDYSFPFAPPEELGGNDYNGKYVGFSVRCPDGEEQAIDPLVEPQVEPTVFTYWRAVPSSGIATAWLDTSRYKSILVTPFYLVQGGDWIAPTEIAYPPGSGPASAGGVLGEMIVFDILLNTGSSYFNYTGTVTNTTPFVCNPVFVFEFSNNQIDVIGTWEGR
jgi:hypothetical protein